MSTDYCKISLAISPSLMQAVKLEAARRNLSVEEMLVRYLSTFLPEKIHQGLLECGDGCGAKS